MSHDRRRFRRRALASGTAPEFDTGPDIFREWHMALVRLRPFASVGVPGCLRAGSLATILIVSVSATAVAVAVRSVAGRRRSWAPGSFVPA